jgi:hypothetical protein
LLVLEEFALPVLPPVFVAVEVAFPVLPEDAPPVELLVALPEPPPFEVPVTLPELPEPTST